MPEQFELPQGSAFLELVAKQEDNCAKETLEHFAHLGTKAPRCKDAIGSVLALLDCASSCIWGCRGGDHLIEYFAGRVASSARAAWRLLLLGFYDESLSITRSIGEAANLLILFATDANALSDWKGASRNDRKSRYMPVHVRTRLQDLKPITMIDSARYSALCEIAVHVTPELRPQGHNLLAMPTSGGYMQEGGILMALNELAIALSHATLPVPKLLGYDKTRTKQFMTASADLLGSIGGMDIHGIERWREQTLAELRAAHAAQADASTPPPSHARQTSPPSTPQNSPAPANADISDGTA